MIVIVPVPTIIITTKQRVFQHGFEVHAPAIRLRCCSSRCRLQHMHASGRSHAHACPLACPLQCQAPAALARRQWRASLVTSIYECVSCAACRLRSI
jgi:hypothetical protein